MNQNGHSNKSFARLTALAGGSGQRFQHGFGVRLCCALNGNLLPAVMRFAAASARTGGIFSPADKLRSAPDFARVCDANRRATEMAQQNADTRAVARLCREIEQQIAEDPERALKLADLSERAGISAHQVHRMFRKIIGITPRQFADALRLRRLKGRLQRGDSVTTALYDAGYGSASRLYEYANAQLGMTPATYRQGGRGMEIVYTIEECPQGKVLVAATDRGVSAVYLGDQDRPLERALHEEYPKANIRKGSGTLGPWVRAIVKHLRGGEKHLDLPLDVEATAFQRRVWQELQKIPYGTTKTYTQVAQALGQPTAARAVARACATNPVSIVVPCHRVVRQSGQLAGYRWGLRAQARAD